MPTRRHFLGQCLAGLSLAHGARLAAQSSAAPLMFTGFRMPAGGRVMVAAQCELYCALSFNGALIHSQTFGNGPSVVYTAQPASVDFSAATGKWTFDLRVRKKDVPGFIDSSQIKDLGVNLHNRFRCEAGPHGVVANFRLVTSTVATSTVGPKTVAFSATFVL